MNPFNARPLPTGTGDVTITSTRTILRGWSLRESNSVAAVATVIIRDGDATGDILAVIELAANTSDTFSCDGIHASNGVFVERDAGETEGTIYIT